MTSDILESLEENILKANEEIQKHKPGTEEYAAAVKTAAELTKVYMELEDKEKSRMRADEDDVVKEREYEAKQKQQNIDNWVKIGTAGLEAAGKAIGAIGTVCLIAYGIAWEKNERVSSSIFKSVLKDVLRFKF